MKKLADKTIKELAEELGVSKQRIQQIIAKLPTSKTPNKVGNKFVLNEKNIYDIKVLMGFEVDNFSTKKLVDYDIYLDVLNSSKEKDAQIEQLQALLAQQQKLIDQQQQLTLQANQQIKQLQGQLLLTTENIEDENESAVQTTSDEVEPVPVKKWWAFWK